MHRRVLWAPAIQINYDFHLDLDDRKMDSLLDEYRNR